MARTMPASMLLDVISAPMKSPITEAFHPSRNIAPAPHMNENITASIITHVLLLNMRRKHFSKLLVLSLKHSDSPTNLPVIPPYTFFCSENTLDFSRRKHPMPVHPELSSGSATDQNVYAAIMPMNIH